MNILKVLTSSLLKCSNIVNPCKSLVSFILESDCIDRIIYKVPFDLILATLYIILSILTAALLIEKTDNHIAMVSTLIGHHYDVHNEVHVRERHL